MDVNNQDQWIVKSGSSQHITNDLHLIYDIESINETMDIYNQSIEV